MWGDVIVFGAEQTLKTLWVEDKLRQIKRRKSPYIRVQSRRLGNERREQKK